MLISFFLGAMDFDDGGPLSFPTKRKDPMRHAGEGMEFSRVFLVFFVFLLAFSMVFSLNKNPNVFFLEFFWFREVERGIL